MNLFFLDRNPMSAALMHNRTHVNKMLTETCQMLSTAHHILDGQEKIVTTITKNGQIRKRKTMVCERKKDLIYKAGHHNHPMAIWIRSSDEHYRWAHELAVSLAFIYNLYRNKVHGCERIGVLDNLKVLPDNINYAGWHSVPLCMNDFHKTTSDEVEAYRNLYLAEKLFDGWYDQIPSWVLSHMSESELYSHIEKNYERTFKRSWNNRNLVESY